MDVYKMTNRVNGKLYVGQTRSGKKRWGSHISMARAVQKKTKKRGDSGVQIVHLAMAKHGPDQFTFEVLAEGVSQEDADALEIETIAELQTRDPEKGYNWAPGGKGWTEEGRKYLSENWQKHHPPESLKKQAEKMRGRTFDHTEETKKKIGEANAKALLGKTQSPETIAKRQATQSANYGSLVCSAPGCDRTDGKKFEGVRYCEKHYMRMRLHGTLDLAPRVAHNKGQPMSEEQKKKVSASRKGKTAGTANPFHGKKHDPETMERIRQANLGKEPPNKMTFTPEEIHKITTDPRGLRKVGADWGISTTVVARLRRENP